MPQRTLCIPLVALLLALPLAACHEEGPMEKAGKKMDRAVDRLRHADEGPLEEAGRKAGEALDQASKTLEEASHKLDELGKKK